jgi:hypothetical protein
MIPVSRIAALFSIPFNFIFIYISFAGAALRPTARGRGTAYSHSEPRKAGLFISVEGESAL